MGGTRSTGIRAREGRRAGVRRTGHRMSLSHQDVVQGRGIGAEGMVRREVGGDARSASGASRAGAMPKVRPGRAGPGRCQKCVRGERGQTWMCGVGPGRAVLHIRAGPAGGGLAESCGNAPALNAVEALPCAERSPLHMGASPLRTDILGQTAESCGKPAIESRGCPSPMCNTPAAGPRGPRLARQRPRRPGIRSRPIPAPELAHLAITASLRHFGVGGAGQEVKSTRQPSF